MNGNGTKNGTPVTPRKFLFISYEGACIDLAWQVLKEGSEVKLHVVKEDDRDVGVGFVEHCSDWTPWKDWADVIVFDDIGFGQLADSLRQEGKHVIGGSSYTDELEHNREFGQQELKKAGINILPKWDFTNFDEAIAFVRQNPGRYVIKPSGRAQSEKDLTFIGNEDDGRDIVEMLDRYKRMWSGKIERFQLQKFVQGIEIALGAYFNGAEFITPINVNFEHKRMFPGDIGPSTGEMGTSMFWIPPNKLFANTLEKMKKNLTTAGYRGYIDLNCIVNGRGIYPLEFTARFGYPTISIQMEGIASPMTDVLWAIGTGEPFAMKTKKGFQIGVVIACPPFPFNDPVAFNKYSKDAVVMFKKPVKDGVHICDIRQEEGEWLLVGAYALIVTGSGSTMEKARTQAYQRIANVSIPNMFYRTDIGKRWSVDSDLLQTWEYF